VTTPVLETVATLVGVALHDVAVTDAIVPSVSVAVAVRFSV
jgi:hypothetical protein